MFIGMSFRRFVVFLVPAIELVLVPRLMLVAAAVMVVLPVPDTTEEEPEAFLGPVVEMIFCGGDFLRLFTVFFSLLFFAFVVEEETTPVSVGILVVANKELMESICITRE